MRPFPSCAACPVLPAFVLLMVALANPCAAASQRIPDIIQVLPAQFSFGTSWFSATRDWSIDAQSQGVTWGYQYTYIFPDTTRAQGTQPIYLQWFWERCQRTKAMPIMSYYGLLRLAEAANLGGSEIEKVVAVCKRTDSMRSYLQEVIRLLKAANECPVPAIFHVEPDSWAFLEWHGSNDTHDANQVVVMVQSTGIPELKDFADTAAGFGKALIHLRDLYAPKLYMGFHAKDCRVATQVEKTVAFIKDCGRWDILLGDGVGHIYDSRGDGWWNTFSESRFQAYQRWYGTLTRELKLPYIHWQSVVGKADIAFLQNYPADGRLQAYARMGSVGICFDIRGDPYTNSQLSDANHGYTAKPPAGSPNEVSATALIRRLAAYSRNPIPHAWRPAVAEKKTKERAPVAAKVVTKERLSLTPEMRAYAFEELRRQTESAIDLGRRPRFLMTALGHEVMLAERKGDSVTLVANDGASTNLQLWRILGRKDALALALALLPESGALGHALVVGLAIDADQPDLARKHRHDAADQLTAFAGVADRL